MPSWFEEAFARVLGWFRIKPPRASKEGDAPTHPPEGIPHESATTSTTIAEREDDE